MRPITRTSRQIVATRPFHISPRQLARKDAQDKDSLKPEPNEYSKSGSDDAAAAVDDAAFNPDVTSPEEEQASAKEHPANQEVSQPKEQPQGQTEGSSAESGGSGSSGRQRTSGGSSPPKSGGGKHGGGSQGV
ncbi:hypothetical protein B0A54_10245 [Friedmanniomyces endolithicus]|uniref:Uncharacterized protein n=1 Tax=Friedmanniomyces endolithicus TaxID=329885 RepID=A0A4U0UV20_9PEZI|nr:hypothetical protein B0A54_10245 [Friedmanniomyces endolithicus]